MKDKSKKPYINIDMELGVDINNLIHMCEDKPIENNKLNIEDDNDKIKKDK